MSTRRLPILVGVGQYTNRSDDIAAALQPLEMMAIAARRAAEDAGVPRLLQRLDSVTVVSLLSWTYADPAGQLAAGLGATPRQKLYTGIGGNTPQAMVNEIADRLAQGEIRLALLTGAEAMHSLRLARKAGVTLPWPERASAPPMLGETKWGNNALEQAHRAQMPTQIYPLFENALRAARSQSIADQRQMLGRLCATFAAVAKENPYAWFRDGKTAAEIATPSPENRMIGFPYPKYMNAIMDVDQSAALLLTDTETARELRVPEDKWVYVLGGGDANDHWYVSDRVNFHTSPAIRAAGAHALRQAGVGIDDISYFDLYSCFPCAPQIAAEMLGIPAGDPRTLTVTGGLPYAGGPGNNYSSHAIAAMAQKLRAHRSAVGLVSGVGWYLTKHAVGVYSTSPPRQPAPRVPPPSYQTEIDAMAAPRCVVEADGPATVETYTVLHDRDGAPDAAIIVGRLENGDRFWANAASDRGLLDSLEREEAIGTRGRARHDRAAGANRFDFSA